MHQVLKLKCVAFYAGSWSLHVGVICRFFLLFSCVKNNLNKNTLYRHLDENIDDLYQDIKPLLQNSLGARPCLYLITHSVIKTTPIYMFTELLMHHYDLYVIVYAKLIVTWYMLHLLPLLIP